MMLVVASSNFAMPMTRGTGFKCITSWRITVHFPDKRIKFLLESFHCSLSFLSDLLCIFQLNLEQFSELFIFLFDLFVLFDLFDQGF